jgi:hypothetical protein
MESRLNERKAPADMEVGELARSSPRPTGGEDIMSDSDIELTRLSSWGREALALEIIRLQAALDAAEKERDDWKQAANMWLGERDRLKSYLSEGGYQTVQSEMAWKGRAEAAERALADALAVPEVWSVEERDGMAAAFDKADGKHGHYETLFAVAAWLLRHRREKING